jgi:hypothetical protein
MRPSQRHDPRFLTHEAPEQRNSFRPTPRAEAVGVSIYGGAMSEFFAGALPSLYSVNAVEVPDRPGNPKPYPPGTVYTASIETIDNDRAALMMHVGVVR